MKALKLLFLPGLLLIISISNIAQERDDQYVSGQYGFKINLPSRPTSVEPRSFQLLTYRVYGESLAWKDVENLYAGMEVYRPFGTKPALTEVEKSDIIAAYKKIFLAEMQDLKLMTSEAPYDFGTSKGVEIRGVSTIRMVTRMFFVKNRLVVLTISSAASNGFDPQLSVLNSFSLLKKDETIAALKKDFTPPLLPLGPAAVRPMTDAQDRQLKGRVRSVVEEMQESPTSQREIKREEFYDPDGNIIGEVTYNFGYPQEVTLWGWIDGKRVSSTNVVFFEPDEAFKPGSTRALGPSTGLLSAPRKVGEKYGSRHDQSYDDKGRIVELKVFSADGSPRFSRKITYTPTGWDVITLDNTGQLLTRILMVVDAKGYVVEERVLDLSGRPFSSVFYDYDFDEKGNWTVKRTKGKAAPQSKAAAKPAPVYYRTISYY